MPKSTTLFLFPDINVWIALTIERHVHHKRATKWFESIGGSGRLFFCRFTQLGFLRLLTLEAVMGYQVMAQADAWKTYDKWLQDDRIGFLEEPPEAEAAFRGFTQSSQAAPKHWADSYLAAFAMTSQLTLVTFDQAFSSKAGAHILLKT
jgi:uncharacterized protein